MANIRTARIYPGRKPQSAKPKKAKLAKGGRNLVKDLQLAKPKWTDTRGTEHTITSVEPDNRPHTIAVNIDSNAFANMELRTFSKFIPVNLKGSQRVSIPKGHGALIFKPGLRIDEDAIVTLVNANAIPQYPVRVHGISKAPDTVQKILDLIGRHPHAIQNAILATVLNRMKAQRELNIDGAREACDSAQKDLDKTQGALREFENIISGGYQIKPV
jgi:hypothetical protein